MHVFFCCGTHVQVCICKYTCIPCISNLHVFPCYCKNIACIFLCLYSKSVLYVHMHVLPSFFKYIFMYFYIMASTHMYTACYAKCTGIYFSFRGTPHQIFILVFVCIKPIRAKEGGFKVILNFILEFAEYSYFGHSAVTQLMWNLIPCQPL
jgi:hypothetical protein